MNWPRATSTSIKLRRHKQPTRKASDFWMTCTCLTCSEGTGQQLPGGQYQATDTDILLTSTATRYLPPYTPHVGPLDPVTFKEATLFTCIRVH